jgi:outer membrane protein assembly factor BamB
MIAGGTPITQVQGMKSRLATAVMVLLLTGSAMSAQVAGDSAGSTAGGDQRPATGNSSWPELRGPSRDGHAHAGKPPWRWSETNNVVWKTPIHDWGWSSPLVWENQVWLTTATGNGREMFAVCVDRQTGKVLQDVKVFAIAEPAHVASVNSYASPTGAIEAERVYVHYGTYGTACLDTGNGKVLWTRRDLKCDHQEGPGSSLMLEGDRLYVNVDGRDVQYVVSLDKVTGETLWKTNRSVDYTPFHINCRKAFSTPMLVPTPHGAQVISVGAKAAMAYEPQTGNELWKVHYNGWSSVPRPLYSGDLGLVYIITDYEQPELLAIRSDGAGDVTETHVAWRLTKDMPATAGLLLVDDLLYLINDAGVALCLEAKTGHQVWRQRLKGKHSASPILAGARIYFFSEKNLTSVIAPGRAFRVLAENQLDDRLMATPAVIGNAIILRSKTHLYRLEGASQ